MQLRVGLPAGHVHAVTLNDDATLTDLEAAVVALENVDAVTHRVRVIASGKLLADSNARLSTLVADGSFVHCAISERPPPVPARRPRRIYRRRGTDDVPMSAEVAARIQTLQLQQLLLQQQHTHLREQHRRTAVVISTNSNGDVAVTLDNLDDDDDEANSGDSTLSADDTGVFRIGSGEIGGQEEAADDSAAESGSGVERGAVRGGGGSDQVVHTVDAEGNVRIILPSPRLRGFDRLGFSPAELAAIRRQFRTARGLPPAAGTVTDEDGTEETAYSDIEADLEAEELWLNAASVDDPTAQNAASDAAEQRIRPGVEGSNADFLFGCILGYLLGVLTLVLLLDKNISRRWRVGIVAGIATNAAFGVLRSSLVIGGSNVQV
jgi:DUF2407 C-terminal domain